MPAFLSFLAPIVGRVLGSHHASNPIAPIQSAAEGLGLRFILGFLLAAYLMNDGVKHAINGLAVAIKTAVIG